ncbi:MAG: hypothetical protein AAFQ52_18565 [Chloroflexota bacterium]
MPDMTPRQPQFRSLYWTDTVLDLAELLATLNLTEPLYIVGGAVRDAFLQKPVKDLDLATPTQSISIGRQIANAANGDVFVLDDERSVARVLLDVTDPMTGEQSKLTLDIAAFRGADLEADLYGRDFTVNAMAVDLLGDLSLLIDPLNGEKDATQKVIRRCSPQAIEEDPIRALRAIRQSTQLGFKIEPQTVADMRIHGTKLIDTSMERIRDEFITLLALDRAGIAIKVMDTLGYLSLILPQISELKDKPLPEPHVFTGWKQALVTVEKLLGLLVTISYRRDDSTAASFAYGMLAMQLDRFRAELNTHTDKSWANDRPHRALLVLGCLLHRVDDSINVTGEVAESLRLSNPEKKQLVAMVRYFEDSQSVDYKDPLAQHRFWYKADELGIDAILLGLADYLATYGNLLDQDAWLIQIERALMMLFAFYEQYDTVVNPPLLVNGNDLMETLDLTGGPIIGDMLTAIREGQVTGDISKPADAIATAKQYLADNA